MFYFNGMLVALMKQILETSLLILFHEQRQAQPQPYVKGWTNHRTLNGIYENNPALHFYPSLPGKPIHRLVGTSSRVLAAECHCA